MACRFLKVSTSGYYDWVTRLPSPRAVAGEALTATIRRMHGDSRGTHDAPRVLAELHWQERSLLLTRSTQSTSFGSAGLSSLRRDDRYNFGIIKRGRQGRQFRPNWLFLAPIGFAALVKLVTIGEAPNGLSRLGNVIFVAMLLFAALLFSIRLYASSLWFRPLRRYNQVTGRRARVVDVDARFSLAALAIDKDYISKLNQGLIFYPQGPGLAESGGPHRVYIDIDGDRIRFLTGWRHQVEALSLSRGEVIRVQQGWGRFDQFYVKAATVTYNHEGEILTFAMIGVGALLLHWPSTTSELARNLRTR